MSPTFQEVHDLLSSDLLPESLLNSIPSQHSMQHVVELSLWLYDELENLSLHELIGVGKDILIVLHYDEPVTPLEVRQVHLLVVQVSDLSDQKALHKSRDEELVAARVYKLQ